MFRAISRLIGNLFPSKKPVEYPTDRLGFKRCLGYRREDFVSCEVCHGTGGTAPDWCPKCGGYGEYPKEITARAGA